MYEICDREKNGRRRRRKRPQTTSDASLGALVSTFLFFRVIYMYILTIILSAIKGRGGLRKVTTVKMGHWHH